MEEKDIKEKGKILNGAKELFRKFGVRSITMDDIAHHLGISKKTIYQFFKDKDEIVQQSIETFLASEKQRISEVEKVATDAIQLMHLLHNCIKESLKNTNVSLLHDLQKYHPGSWKIIEEYRLNFMRVSVSNNVKWGIETGLFRDDIDVEILSLMRLEQASLAHNDHIFPRTKYSLMQIQRQFFDHFVQGLLTDKGRKLYKKHKKEFDNVII